MNPEGKGDQVSDAGLGLLYFLLQSIPMRTFAFLQRNRTKLQDNIRRVPSHSFLRVIHPVKGCPILTATEY